MSVQNHSTPLGQVRGLGSAKSGVAHHIRQRVSAVALIGLLAWFLYSVIDACSQGYAGVLLWLSQPINAILMILTLAAAFYHMRLGMQVVIEDYIEKSGSRQALLIANTFLAGGLFAAGALSVLKIWISAG